MRTPSKPKIPQHKKDKYKPKTILATTKQKLIRKQFKIKKDKPKAKPMPIDATKSTTKPKPKMIKKTKVQKTVFKHNGDPNKGYYFKALD